MDIQSERVAARQPVFGWEAERAMKVGVIIPALNAASHLPALLADIRGLHPQWRILVVDDGSTDDTAGVARATGVEVWQHQVNRGKGAALATGFAWALAEGCRWVFTIDADGQHLPREMGGFLREARAWGFDVVVGTRMADTAGMPWVRRATNRFTSWVISRLAGCRIVDSQSGFRLFRTACLKDLRLKTSRYDTESEILVRLAWRECRIGSVPVSTIYGEQRSSIKPLADTGRFIRLVCQLLRDRPR